MRKISIFLLYILFLLSMIMIIPANVNAKEQSTIITHCLYLGTSDSNDINNPNYYVVYSYFWYVDEDTKVGSWIPGLDFFMGEKDIKYGYNWVKTSPLTIPSITTAELIIRNYTTAGNSINFDYYVAGNFPSYFYITEYNPEYETIDGNTIYNNNHERFWPTYYAYGYSNPSRFLSDMYEDLDYKKTSSNSVENLKHYTFELSDVNFHNTLDNLTGCVTYDYHDDVSIKDAHDRVRGTKLADFFEDVADSRPDLGDPDDWIILPDSDPEPDPEVPANCETLLGNPKNKKYPAYYLAFAFKIIRYVAIILLVVLSVMDFLSAVTSHDDDELKNAMNKTIKRLIICIIIFMLPALIEFILTSVYNREISICISSNTN